MNSKNENGNLEIARMLGWFQQEGQVSSKAWFQTEETGNVISITTINGLRFNCNWNDLMIALAFIERLGFDTSINHYNTNADHTVVEIKKDGKIIVHQLLINKIVEWNNNNSTKKEALFLAVSVFASQYNNAEMLKNDLKEQVFKFQKYKIKNEL